MSVLPRTILDSLSSEPSPWPGALDEGAIGRLESVLEELPEEVRLAVLAALADPTRRLWARGILDGVAMARSAGCRPVGMLHEEVVELTTETGGRLGLGALDVPQPPARLGHQPTLDELTRRLEQVFEGKPFVLYLRRPLPEGIDVDGIVRAFHLWLSAVARGERHERHAVYEDGDLAFEVTLGEGACPASGPRLLTVGPITTLERLAEVDMQLVDAAVRVEESIGDVPMVMICAADRPWGLPRGYVEQLLYGTADCTVTQAGDGPGSYRATFRPNGRSLFSDPVCRHILSVWWTSPEEGGDPLGFDCQATDNPWAADDARVVVPCPSFRVVEGPDGSGTVTLGWSGPTS